MSNLSKEWTTVTYIKTPKKYTNYGDDHGDSRGKLNGSTDSSASTFEKGTQYIPFGGSKLNRSGDNLNRSGDNLNQSGDAIPFSTKERRFVSKKDINSNKTDSESESAHQRLVSKDLAKRITQYRKTNNVTQLQLANQLGIPLDVVQGYEKATAVSNKAYNGKFHTLVSQK